MRITLLIFNIFFLWQGSFAAQNEPNFSKISSTSLDSIYRHYKIISTQLGWEEAAKKTLQDMRLNPQFSDAVASCADGLYNRSVREQNALMQLSSLFMRCLIADQNYSDLNTILTLSKEAHKVAKSIDPCEEINMQRYLAELMGNPKYKKQEESYSILHGLRKEAVENQCWKSLIYIFLNQSDILSTNFYDIQESLMLKLEAVDLAKKHIPNSLEHAFATSECGKAYYHAYAIPEAIFHWKNALSMYENLPEKRTSDLIRVNNDLGLAYSNINQFDTAEYYYDRAYAIAQKYKNELWIGLIQGNRSYLLAMKGNTSAAIDYLKNDLAISIKAHETESAAATSLELLRLYLDNKIPSEAKTYLDTSKYLLTKALNDKPYSSGFGVNRSWLKYYKALAQYYSMINKPDSAVSAYKIFIKLNDSINGSNKFRELALRATLQYRLKHEVSSRQEKESENLVLIKQSEYKTNMMIALVITVLIIGGFAFLLYRSKEDLKVLLHDLHQQKEKVENQREALKNVTLDLKHSNEELSRINQLKDKLFSLVAHDLRAPLNTVKGVLTLFKDQDISEESLKNYVPQMEENVGETLNMLDNLLNWAKSQLDGYKIKPQQVELNELVKQNFKLMAAEADKKDVKFINNLSVSLQATADKEMINLVIRNLIHNAIKFTVPGDRIVVDGAYLNNEVILNISDTGIGMTEEQLNNILAKKMNTTLGTANERGTGLGLQLCFDFVKMNQGKIEIHSRKGQGTVFSIYLPL